MVEERRVGEYRISGVVELSTGYLLITTGKQPDRACMLLEQPIFVAKIWFGVSLILCLAYTDPTEEDYGYLNRRYVVEWPSSPTTLDMEAR